MNAPSPLPVVTTANAERTLLLVEDTPEDVELATRALRHCGYIDNIVIVRDGQDALDYLFAEGTYAARDRSLQPAVVLLDLKLPRLNGFDVLARLRSDQRTYRTPIIVLTASDNAADINRAYELGACSYVHKHVEFGQYVAALRKIAEYWLEFNIAPASRRSIALRAADTRATDALTGRERH